MMREVIGVKVIIIFDIPPSCHFDA
ncbi:protein of unknown function [Ralstonia solanacearum CMR15]|nr:protein of unknown function [Ralstonia solanacearum CMR15]